MISIFKKEFKNYFKTPIGYVFLAPFVYLAAQQFCLQLINTTVITMEYIFSAVNLLCLFIVPVLTMQVLSEERAKKTDQLLLTAPVSVWDIILGKFLASYAVFGIGCVITFLFPAVFEAFGTPIWSEIIGQYIGFILLWGAFISVGIFVSSCTESQVVSAILTFVVLFLLYNLDAITSGISTGWARTVINWFSIMNRQKEFYSGLLNLPDMIYFFSFIGIFLFLAKRNTEARRYK